VDLENNYLIEKSTNNWLSHLDWRVDICISIDRTVPGTWSLLS
jgi:hypothetical protein